MATLSVRRAGERPLDYLKIRFTDVVITSFEQGADQDVPTERVAFEFAKVELTYTSQDPRGGPGAVSKAGWDLHQNVKI
jgi:type VI secretion system secreted protein Hcp